MTLLSVVSSITTVGGSGIVNLGDIKTDILTVGTVKERMEQRTSISSQEQKLWWRGYILDNDSLPLTKACVGECLGEWDKTEMEVDWVANDRVGSEEFGKEMRTICTFSRVFPPVLTRVFSTRSSSLSYLVSLTIDAHSTF